jgi:hypothetical protein
MKVFAKGKLFSYFFPLVIFVFTWGFFSPSLYAQEDIRALRGEIRKMREESERQRKQIGALEEKLKRIEARKDQEAASKEEVKKLAKKVESLSPGFENFLLTGYGTVNYTDNTDDGSTFGASVNPVFLWSITDKLLFEAELEFELEDRETEVALEYAQIHYLLHDNVTVGAGKFFVPFTIFMERLHPTWINKLPSKPIPWGHHGGIAPMVEFGFQVRGGVPLYNEARANYAFYVTNGPELLTSGHHAGELRFGNANDNNNNKALGGRIGILPIPEMELGLSYMRARVGDGDFRNVHADIFGGDFSYIRDSEFLLGKVDLRFEYAQQWIDSATYIVDATAFDFNNSKSGWYTQIAYRPTRLGVPILPDLEAVFRYSTLKWPSGTPLAANEPGDGVDRQQFTLGITYWIKPSVPLKISYDLNDNEGRETNDFRVQLSYGF